MIKQLACTINTDDFEDKSTKNPSIATTSAPDITYTSTSHETTPAIKTTKPWMWANTVDTGEYSSPTRHRRGTENTMSPLSTQSTRDIGSTKPALDLQQRTQTTSKYGSISETVTSGDVALNSYRSSVKQREDKSQQTSTDSIPAETSGTPDGQADLTATLETKASESADSEYPSAINQGQLFGIIENGTVFDIVEMNATGTEVSKHFIETS